MLSKNKIKYIHSLELKKYRKEEQAFIAEGHKLVGKASMRHCKRNYRSQSRRINQSQSAEIPSRGFSCFRYATL